MTEFVVKYRGIDYNVVQGIKTGHRSGPFISAKPQSSGEAKTRSVAIANAVTAIDKALKPRKLTLPGRVQH